MKENNKQKTSKEKQNERLKDKKVDDDVLVVKDFSELGDFDTAEEYCKRLDDILNGKWLLRDNKKLYNSQ